MKTKSVIFSLGFLCLSIICPAQIKVDSLGSVFFGKAQNTTRGFYFKDLTSTGSSNAFSIIRKSTGDVVFGRGDSTTAGLMFGSVNGIWAVGNNLSVANLFRIDGNGVIYVNGTPLSTSDISLKSNIETLSNSLDKVLQLRGSTLQPGMYLYSLIADGQEVDTKRMLLTK